MTVNALQSSSTTAKTAASQTATSATNATTGTQASASPLSSLSGKFSDFLKMLMTQLQNQDPTSPMDTNQFTSQLVQFSSVEQQINTNSSLTQLITLTQSASMLQSAALIGNTVSVQSDQLPLQSGQAALQFVAPTSEPVTVTVSTSAGTVIGSETIAANSGNNVWTWNGTNAAGTKMPDGPYNVSVTSGSGAQTLAVPFTVQGIATGVTSTGSTLKLQLGATTVDLANVRSIVK